MAWMLLVVLLSGHHLTRHDDLIECELMELNHSVSCDGVSRFDQVILWRWSPDYRRWEVQYWAMVGTTGSVAEYPAAVGKRYECRLTNNGRRVLMRSKLFRETWTDIDPERENIRLFPVQMRNPDGHWSTCVAR